MSYSINSYDKFSGRYGGGDYNPLSIRGRNRNQTMPVSIPLNDANDNYDNELNDDEIAELDRFVNIIRKKTDSEKVHVVDRGKSKSKGQNFVTNVGGYMTEKRKNRKNFNNHTNPIMKGITPRLTYSKRNKKGPAFGVSSNAMHLRVKPARKTGTLYGWSKGHFPSNNEISTNIWSLKDIDPFNNAMIRQNKIRIFINSLG
jgi:hypothetical protein